MSEPASLLRTFCSVSRKLGETAILSSSVSLGYFSLCTCRMLSLCLSALLGRKCMTSQPVFSQLMWDKLANHSFPLTKTLIFLIEENKHPLACICFRRINIIYRASVWVPCSGQCTLQYIYRILTTMIVSTFQIRKLKMNCCCCSSSHS